MAKLFPVTTRSRALVLLGLAFALSLLVRMPTLNRPLSKHHEFNTAVILIGVQSWQQAGGAARFHLVPLMNYQDKGDLALQESFATDEKGNTLYLSFGPGWYVIPYYFFNIFKLPATPLSLQLLNLLFNAITLVLLFFLLERLGASLHSNHYGAVLMACSLFLFSPGMLWFLGNGYVCTGIVLPFILGISLIVHKFFQDPRHINFQKLLMCALLVITAIYIDWYGVFFSCGVIGASLFHVRRTNRYWLVITAFMASTGAALVLITWQFASYIGFHQLRNYWKIRFTNRSLVQQKSHLADVFTSIAAHMATSYLPGILFMLLLFLALKVSGIKSSLSRGAIIMLVIFSSSLLAYNIVFLEWSGEHEFSVIPYALLFACACVFLLQQTALNGLHKLFFWMAILLSLAQYYYINRPGRVSMHKTLYPDYRRLGTRIKDFARPGYAVFLPGESSPMTEYYAGRTLHFVKDYEEALAQIRASGTRQSMWIEHRNFNITHVRYIIR